MSINQPSRSRERSRKAAPSNVPSPISTTPVSRRKILTLLGSCLAIAAGTAAYQALKPETSPQPSPGVPDGQNEVPNIDQQFQKVEQPSFHLTNQKVNFPVPDHVQVDRTEATRIAQAFASELKQEIALTLNPLLLRPFPPEVKSKILQEFIGVVAGHLEQSSPHAARAMEEFSRSWKQDPFQLVHYLNTYLHLAGYNLYFTQAARGHIKVGLYPITTTQVMEVRDEEESLAVPVLRLGTNLVTDPSMQLEKGVVGNMDPLFTYAQMFDAEIPELKKDLFKKNPHVVGNRATEEESLEMDTLRHETGHAFLARKFPAAATTNRRDIAYLVPLELPFASDFTASLTGNYAPVMFQELCGVGIQIAQSKLSVPFHLNSYLGSSEAETYVLLGRILPLLVLWLAPASTAKAQLVEKMKREGTADLALMKSLVESPDFGMDRTREVGKWLYSIGYEVLRKMEKGELQRV